MNMNRDVIIACDFCDKSETLVFLKKFGEQKHFIKIGMELFYCEGADFVRALKERGHKNILD